MHPTEITLKRPSRWSGWIPTFSGQGFRPIDPKIGDVRIEDIARGLAYKFRYGGHTSVTVAEHSLLVAQIIQIMWPQSGCVIGGLLHDACEAYTHDIQAPIRKSIKVELASGELITWGDMERRINRVVAKALKVDPDFYSAPEIQAADILAAALKKDQCSNLKPGNWGLPNIPPEIAHLKIEFLSPRDAYDRYLQELKSQLGITDVNPSEP